eukprot:gene125-4371_t
MFNSRSQDEEVELQDIIKNHLKAGYLIKQGKKKKSWKNRYFVLTPTHLYYFQNNHPRSKSLGGIFLLGDPLFYSASRGDLECLKTPSIKFETPMRVLYAYSIEDTTQVEKWIDLFNQITKDKSFDDSKYRIENEIDEEVTEELILKLKNEIEKLKGELNDYFYKKFGVRDVEEITNEEFTSTEELEILLTKTKIAIKKLTTNLKQFEKNLKQETRDVLMNFDIHKEISSKVENIEKIVNENLEKKLEKKNSEMKLKLEDKKKSEVKLIKKMSEVNMTKQESKLDDLSRPSVPLASKKGFVVSLKNQRRSLTLEPQAKTPPTPKSVTQLKQEKKERFFNTLYKDIPQNEHFLTEN